ncbi:hypothetical protein F6X40_10280 [Paraburkholderia sp. UCT31]|uniref:hypothetical protein n=1 Tax=Paraburkholderia sp. UCT31 TaxID=2615209 RepID=UPI001655C479|nr:hypothetical protein [Paraburkholderia sp. UCT31]MBC8737195.1 hypothetical protein [Paraburkholderia sp. UCT31]
MRNITPKSDYATNNAAQLAKSVLTEAPISKKAGKPVVRAYIRADSRTSGFTMVAETLSDRSSAQMTMAHIGKESAIKALNYLKGIFSSCGFKTVETDAEWSALKEDDESFAS